MDFLTATHVVTRAGAAFGFSLMVITGMVLYFSRGRTFSALKSKQVLLPWGLTALTMVLASAVTGGLIGQIAGSFTSTGNTAGAQTGHLMVGQDGQGAVHVSVTQVLSYSGSWLVFVMLVGVVLFLWFAKDWRERALAVSGALTGATWGLASSIGGWAAAVGVPLVSWIAEKVIG
jgi:hypothetical protein